MWARDDLCVNVNRGTMRLVVALVCQVSLQATVQLCMAQCAADSVQFCKHTHTHRPLRLTAMLAAIEPIYIEWIVRQKPTQNTVGKKMTQL